jgi:hypothetical protein
LIPENAFIQEGLMNTRCKATSAVATLLLSLCTVIAVEAGTDNLEDIGPDGTTVTTRVIDGVTVTITTAGGTPLLARTYTEGTAAFLGAGGQPNAPLNPTRVSGTRFISTSYYVDGDDNPLNTLSQLGYLVFEFDTPVATFGFTTIDLMEGPILSPDPLNSVHMVVVDSADSTLAIQIEYRRSVLSGGEFIWTVKSISGDISKVYLVPQYYQYNWETDYGIDDLIVVHLPPTPVESKSWGAIKALYR